MKMQRNYIFCPIVAVIFYLFTGISIIFAETPNLRIELVPEGENTYLLRGVAPREAFHALFEAPLDGRTSRGGYLSGVIGQSAGRPGILFGDGEGAVPLDPCSWRNRQAMKDITGYANRGATLQQQPTFLNRFRNLLPLGRPASQQGYILVYDGADATDDVYRGQLLFNKGSVRFIDPDAKPIGISPVPSYTAGGKPYYPDGSASVIGPGHPSYVNKPREPGRGTGNSFFRLGSGGTGGATGGRGFRLNTPEMQSMGIVAFDFAAGMLAEPLNDMTKSDCDDSMTNTEKEWAQKGILDKFIGSGPWDAIGNLGYAVGVAENHDDFELYMERKYNEFWYPWKRPRPGSKEWLEERLQNGPYFRPNTE